MLSTSLVIVSALAALVHGDLTTSSAASIAPVTTVSQVMPPAATAAFNPSNISETDAFNWCHAQLNTCPVICGGAASQNVCNQNSFTYTCVCANGTVPDCTAYQQTLPFFICQATFSQCILNNVGNAQGQQTCTNNEQCGTLNATAIELAASSASAAASATTASSSSGTASTGSSTASAATASSTHNSALANAEHLGTGVFVAILAAAMKLLL